MPVDHSLISGHQTAFNVELWALLLCAACSKTCIWVDNAVSHTVLVNWPESYLTSSYVTHTSMLCEIYAYVHSHIVLQSIQVKQNPKMVKYLRSGAGFFHSLGASFWRRSTYMFYFIFFEWEIKMMPNPLLTQIKLLLPLLWFCLILAWSWMLGWNKSWSLPLLICKIFRPFCWKHNLISRHKLLQKFSWTVMSSRKEETSSNIILTKRLSKLPREL